MRSPSKVDRPSSAWPRAFRIPAMYEFRDYVADGGLISYGASTAITRRIRGAGGQISRSKSSGTADPATDAIRAYAQPQARAPSVWRFRHPSARPRRRGDRIRRREDMIAGTAITAALSFAKPVHAQTDARSPRIKRVAIVHNAEKPEDMTINGRRSFKAYFGELKSLGYVDGRNLLRQPVLGVRSVRTPWRRGWHNRCQSS